MLFNTEENSGFGAVISSHEQPIWRLLEQSAQELTNEGLTPFKRGDLIERVQSKKPGCPPDSINPMIQGITDNLRGGAPGAVGKKILHSVGLGQFILKSDERSKVTSTPNSRPKISAQSEPKTEADLRDIVMLSLYETCGIPESLEGAGSTMSFRLGAQILCEAEQKLSYMLPSGVELKHASDILISDAARNRFISIEIKYKSAVTDQFKCRSYDIQHLKNQYGDSLLGVMLFVKSRSGISINRAKAICYAFDRFFGIPVSEFGQAPVDALEPLSKSIKEFISDS